MNSFSYIWKLLAGRGFITDRYKEDASRVWDGYTLDEQRAIYRSIRDKLHAGKFVHYNPVIAIQENAPKRVVAEPQLLSPAEQWRNIENGVRMAVVKWKGRCPVVTKADALRFGLEVVREF